MGGLFLDVFALYLWKTVPRLFLLLESMRWRRIPATVLNCTVNDPGIGCPSITVDYRVTFDSESFNGQDQISFLVAGDARRMARRYAKGIGISVRVHPTHRTETAFFNVDQPRTLLETWRMGLFVVLASVIVLGLLAAMVLRFRH